MNILCVTDFEIGMMGQLMIILENIEANLETVDHIKNIVITNTRKRINANPFEHIFITNEPITNYDLVYNISCMPVYYNVIPSDKLLRYKTVISKFILNSEITDRFNKIKNELLINDTFLGVHVRLSDMNTAHGSTYGCVYFENFVKCIDYAMNTNEYTKIFIASDTQEAISKLKNIYGDRMVCYDDFIRIKEENGDLIGFIAANLPINKKWIQDTFIEMLLLAECGGFIQRVSNFANVVKVYSNTIKKMYFISGGEDRYKTTIKYIENGIIKSTIQE